MNEETQILNVQAETTNKRGSIQLHGGTTLQQGKYRIERVLGQGGFGITYMAIQTALNKRVAIKEFFFREYCERDAVGTLRISNASNTGMVERFRQKFEKEARTISQLSHPNIVSIHDTFKENGTAYYVMDYIEGQSLEEMVNQSGALPENIAIDYIKQVASALDYIHKRSINHLDVKPANIMVRRSDNKAILIDFGVSKQYDAYGGQTSTTPIGISHGYAPIEQYNPNGVATFSPQTDIYSLGATLYKLVTGKTPPSAMAIVSDGNLANSLNVQNRIRNAIGQAMQSRKTFRPQSVVRWLDVLNKVSSDNKESIFADTREKIECIVLCIGFMGLVISILILFFCQWWSKETKDSWGLWSGIGVMISAGIFAGAAVSIAQHEKLIKANKCKDYEY